VHINWRAIGSGVVGGIIAAAVGSYALMTGLGAHPDSYTTSGMVWAAVVALLGGAAATAAGWGLNGRREAGLGGIAAIVALLGAVGATAAWASVIASLVSTWQLVTATVLMLGVALVALAAVCGTTAAVLKPASSQREREAVV
jgi:hypothetical protein